MVLEAAESNYTAIHPTLKVQMLLFSIRRLMKGGPVLCIYFNHGSAPYRYLC